MKIGISRWKAPVTVGLVWMAEQYSVRSHQATASPMVTVNDIGICVRIGVATLSSYEHCSGNTELNVKVCMEILFVFVFIPADYYL